jgi:hypothetical protein
MPTFFKHFNLCDEASKHKLTIILFRVLFLCIIPISNSHDSPVGIVLGYGLDNQGSRV